jgi:serine/threonine protein kinase
MEPLTADDPRGAGEFRLRARLGAGGMGRVYLGMSPAGRAVAVKVVHPELARDTEFVARFRSEVAAQAVNGIYTAQVVAAGLYDNPPWLATAYIPGPTLDQLIDERGPLPEAALWRLAAGLAEALGAVHVAGLAHRDLKPNNVLMAEDGPRVIDFGVSRALDGTSATRTGMTFGTPPFMSPEQARGFPVGSASDVFSLGSVVCFAATGQPPFGDGNALSVLYRIVNEQPAISGIPGALRDLAARCLSKDPASRPGLPELTAALAARGTEEWDGSFWPANVLTAIRGYRGTDRPSFQLAPSTPAPSTPAASTPAASTPAAGTSVSASAVPPTTRPHAGRRLRRGDRGRSDRLGTQQA